MKHEKDCQLDKTNRVISLGYTDDTKVQTALYHFARSIENDNGALSGEIIEALTSVGYHPASFPADKDHKMKCKECGDPDLRMDVNQKIEIKTNPATGKIYRYAKAVCEDCGTYNTVVLKDPEPVP